MSALPENSLDVIYVKPENTIHIYLLKNKKLQHRQYNMRYLFMTRKEMTQVQACTELCLARIGSLPGRVTIVLDKEENDAVYIPRIENQTLLFTKEQK